MLRSGGVLFSLLLLAGCTGVDGEHYLGRPGSPAWFATASPNTVAAYFRTRCSAYGFKDGTDAMARCVENEAQSRQSSNAVRSIALMQAATAVNPAPTAPSRPVHCTTTAMGNMLNTNCY